MPPCQNLLHITKNKERQRLPQTTKTKNDNAYLKQRKHICDICITTDYIRHMSIPHWKSDWLAIDNCAVAMVVMWWQLNQSLRPYCRYTDYCTPPRQLYKVASPKADTGQLKIQVKPDAITKQHTSGINTRYTNTSWQQQGILIIWVLTIQPSALVLALQVPPMKRHSLEILF